MSIKNVAIAGATGTIGSAITKALVDSGKFNVTALTRGGGSAPPGDVKSVTIDFSDPASLAAALKGQDAVVSALGNMTGKEQSLLIDASVAAKVKRFLPSEFGSDTMNPKAATLPLYGSKKAAQKQLAELAEQSKLSYTLVVNGPFLDFGIASGFLGLDLKKKQVTFLDGGDTKFSATTTSTVGTAVAAVLANAAETENRVVYVQEALVSLKGLLGSAKEAVGAQGWTEVDGGTTDAMVQSSYEKLGKGQHDMGVMMGFLMAAIYGPTYGAELKHLDNKVLGISQIGESDIVGIIKGIAAK